MSLMFPEISPIAFSVGPVLIRWYGLMYVIGILGAWGLASLRARHNKEVWTSERLSDLVFYIALGIILGGRIGYLLFYDFSGFVADPMMMLRIWAPGRSFHGGLLGVLFCLWLFARKYKMPFFVVTDFMAPFVPIGLGAGRIGNFINGELWGRATDVPWGMIFPHVDNLARHPSQLYQFMLEGVVMFVVLWTFSRRPRPVGMVSGLFLLLYSVFRVAVEFVREPDPQLGFIAFNWMTMGQLLCVPMLVLGLYLFFRHKCVSKGVCA